jgi:hypothetical protein
MRSALFLVISIAVGLLLLTGCGARRWEAGGGFLGGMVEGLARGAPSYTMYDAQREVLMLGFRTDGYLAWWQYQQH